MIRRWVFLGLSLILLGSVGVQASPSHRILKKPTQVVAYHSKSRSHFFDRENMALFAGVAAVRVLDFTSTEHFRERGNDEILLTNSIVDNKPLFASIEAAGFAASVAVSYWLYRRGHYRLERWVSIIHIGLAGAGDIHNYALGPVSAPRAP